MTHCFQKFSINSCTQYRQLRRGSQKKQLRKYGHMSKLGLPYLPSTLVWTKKSLDKYPLVDPTYLSKKFGHFGIKSCHFTLFSQVFNKNFFSKSLHFSENRNPQIDEGSQFRLFRHGGSRPPYQYQEYKYGHPYLTYLPQIFLSKLFFQKKFGWEVPYLPTVWTYVHTFVVFFFGTLS